MQNKKIVKLFKDKKIFIAPTPSKKLPFGQLLPKAKA